MSQLNYSIKMQDGYSVLKFESEQKELCTSTQSSLLPGEKGQDIRQYGNIVYEGDNKVSKWFLEGIIGLNPLSKKKYSIVKEVTEVEGLHNKPRELVNLF